MAYKLIKKEGNMKEKSDTFICIICREKFDNFFKDKDLDDTCKYCAEFEVFNETLRKEKEV